MTVEQWLNNEELPITIWKNKYRNGDEDFESWLDRVSGGKSYLKRLIEDKKFIFAGRILANRGVTDRKITLSNCYVITPPQDNLESIFETGAKLARTFSYGGGCGVDVSNLRPKGAFVHNAAKTTTGPTSFMDFYSYITGLIGQEGRRGATMLSISCNHPDLEEFINLKSDLDVCTKANISVRMNTEFMKAAINDEDYLLRWPIDQDLSYFSKEYLDCPYDTLTYLEDHRRNNEIFYIKKVKARRLFELLAQRNWEMAEPGILYWDRISDYNLLQGTDFRYAGVNPCAEEPLPAGGSCLLGSINLSEFVIDPFTAQARFDYDGLEETVVGSILALNDVLIEGLPLHPLKEQRDSVYDWHQIGLGTMGLADALIKLGIKYDDPKALSVIEYIYKVIATTSVQTSLDLAKTHGCFPKCSEDVKEKIVNSDFIKNLKLPESDLSEIRKYGLFNSQLLTCAPTGSISTMFQVSGGVEPNYAFSFNRRTVSLNEKETVYKVYAKIVRDYNETNKTDSNSLPNYFVASQDIDPFRRVDVQSVLQRYIDASISSTVNLAENTTVETVADIYLYAWEKGLKGITIWRDGCQRQAILSTDKTKKDSANTTASTISSNPDGDPLHRVLHTPVRKVSDDCIGKKRTLVTGCGTLHLTAFFDRHTGQLLETYFSKGSSGGCALFMVGLSRMVSLAARANVSIEAIVDQLKSSGTCPSYAVRTATKKDTSKGSCCPVAIGYALMDMYNEMQSDLCFCRGIKDSVEELKQEIASIPDKSIQLEAIHRPKCPECGEPLQTIEGCMSCPSCGYSKC